MTNEKRYNGDNFQGAMTGGLAGIVMNLWVSIGSVFDGNAAPKSPSAGTDGCYGNGSLVYMYNNTEVTSLTTVSPTLIPATNSG